MTSEPDPALAPAHSDQTRKGQPARARSAEVFLRMLPVEALRRIRPAYASLSIVVVAYLYRYVTFKGWRVGGDGFYSWIFARSLAFDGDLHLRNDYALCGDPWHMGVDEGGGRPANPFYLGPALLWAPLLRVLRALVPLGAHPSASWRNGCEGPWVTGTLVLAPLLGALTVWLGYRLARRFCGQGPAAASMLVVALCSPLLHYATLTVSYSHVWAAFGVAVALITWVRATERPTSMMRWFAAGAGVGLAALMRPQAAVLLLAPAIILGARVLEAGRARRWPLHELVSGLVTLAGFAALFWIQLYAYKLLYGKYWVVTQGRSYLHLAHSHPILMLFAPRGGFLSWHPMMWLGTIGLVMLVLRRGTRLLGAALALPLVIDAWVSGAVLDWHGGASFGARRLVTLAAPWIATGGLFLARVWNWLSRSRARLAWFAATGWLLPWVVINFGASTGNVDDRIGYSRAVPMPELYGTGLRIGLEGVYESVGNPFVLPASLPFALRYGVHPRAFDLHTNGGMFGHSYRPVALRGPDTVPFNNPAVDGMLVEGMRRTPEGAIVRGGTRGRWLNELEWPYVTHVEISARPLGSAPVRLHVLAGSFLRRREVGSVTIPPGGGVVTLATPPGAFDSGPNEIVLEPSGDVLMRYWRWIDRAPHDSSIR